MDAASTIPSIEKSYLLDVVRVIKESPAGLTSIEIAEKLGITVTQAAGAAGRARSKRMVTRTAIEHPGRGSKWLWHKRSNGNGNGHAHVAARPQVQPTKATLVSRVQHLEAEYERLVKQIG